MGDGVEVAEGAYSVIGTAWIIRLLNVALPTGLIAVFSSVRVAPVNCAPRAAPGCPPVGPGKLLKIMTLLML